MQLTVSEPVDRDEWVEFACRQRKVLHVGCTDSPLTLSKGKTNQLLHQKLLHGASEIVGIDVDVEGIKVMTEDLGITDVRVDDAEMLATVTDTYEVVVACDVVEHLSNPGRFFERVHGVVEPGGSLLVTVPNALSLKRLGIAMFTGREHVHPDHVAYYSVSTLSEVARRSGWAIEAVHPFAWKNPTARNRIANSIVTGVMTITRRFSLADELAVVLRSAL